MRQHAIQWSGPSLIPVGSSLASMRIAAVASGSQLLQTPPQTRGPRVTGALITRPSSTRTLPSELRCCTHTVTFALRLEIDQAPARQQCRLADFTDLRKLRLHRPPAALATWASKSFVLRG